MARARGAFAVAEDNARYAIAVKFGGLTFHGHIHGRCGHRDDVAQEDGSILQDHGIDGQRNQFDVDGARRRIGDDFHWRAGGGVALLGELQDMFAGSDWQHLRSYTRGL